MTGLYERKKFTSSDPDNDITLSVDFIKRQAAGNRRVTNETDAKYYDDWVTFNRFLLKLDHIPRSWEERVFVYLNYLEQTTHQSGTLQVYKTAIKYELNLLGIDFDEDKFDLKATIRTCKYRNDRCSIRSPIRWPMLHAILDKIDQTYMQRGQEYLAKLYRAMVVLGYYALLRVGEMTRSKHNVSVRDVVSTVSKRKLQVILRTSKTHGLGDYPKVINVPFSSNNLNSDIYLQPQYCPFFILREYGKLYRPKFLTPDEPFFVFSDRSAVKAAQFRRMLKKMIKLIGINPDCYNTHSLRSGAAVDLFHNGASLAELMVWGRWESLSLLKYLKC